MLLKYIYVASRQHARSLHSLPAETLLASTTGAAIGRYRVKQTG
jgi:hypothetical protein